MKNKKGRLFYIEDDKVDQMAFVRFAKEQGLPYDYIIAGSVDEAKKVLASEKFDIVVTDFLLNDGNAFDLFDDIKATPIIVVTGSGDEETAVKAMKRGASDYLIKDLDRNYLKALSVTIENALRHKQNEEELKQYRKNLETLVKERTDELQQKIIEHKQAEVELRKQAAFFNYNPAPVLQSDYQGTIIKYNRSARTTFDKSLSGESLYRLLPSIDESAVKDMKHDRPLLVEQRIDGKIFLFTIMNETKSKSLFLYGSDITELRDMEERLQQSQKMEAIGTLAGGIAHDFNNILGGIMGFSELARDDTPPESPVQEYISEILKLTGRARDLIRQILTFSRKDYRERKSILIHLILKEVVKLIRSTVSTSIEIRQDIDEQTGMLKADPTQMHQLIMNLCTNAVHAMAGRDGVLDISSSPVTLDEATVKLYHDLKPGPYIELKIRDTGNGIDPKIIDRIFEPFFTTKQKERGTGMGLAVVHGIVKSYKGDIIVDSRLGKGTTFTILLPRVLGESARDEMPLQPVPTGSERILLVDDEKVLTSVLSRLLESLGYSVTVKNRSLEALELFERSPGSFDLVITDHGMPHLTGFNLAERMLAIRPDISIILSTGFSETVSREKAEEIGIKAFVMKPVQKKVIAETIRRVLSR